ncbi:hypothetical protein FA13DRAFT_1794037 [Coprinellus micaceus]|uniref:Uncharacterized protein n=1 Tax=Coprinellus micaceus TaxID=71717 RepID=A0A4Y7T2V4_COPMI|nr:hypothetical protein FA13DRAFT_1794037 [Coprinellus micaceus]
MVFYEISIEKRGGLKVSDPRTVPSDGPNHVYLLIGTRSGEEWKTWKTWKLEEKYCKEWVSGSSYRLEINDPYGAGCVVILNRSFKGVGDAWYGAGLGNARPLTSNLTTELGGGVSLTLSRPSSCVGLPSTSIKPATDGELRFQTLHGSASYLCTLSQRSTPTGVLEIALGVWKTAIEMKVDISEMVNAFEGLTRAVQDQFDRGLKMKTLGRVVSAMEKAAAGFSDDDQKSAKLLNQLGTVQRIQFSWCSSHVSDILEAINNDRRALSVAEASSSPLIPAVLHSLSLSLGRAYRFTSDVAFIEEALALGKRAAVKTVQDDIYTLRLLDLGRLYVSFFEDSGDPGHAAEAIQLFEMARSRGELAGDLDVVVEALCSLGSAFMARYTQMFDTADSSRGIEVLRDALRLVPKDDSKRPRVMSELGRNLLVAWDSQNQGTIQEAVYLFRQAIALTPEDDLELPTRLQGLAHALEWSFYRTMDPELISEAITLYELAIQIDGGEATIPGERLLGVTRALGIRSMVTSEAVDVGEYNEAVNRSIHSLRESGGDWLRLASDLGVFWMERFRQDGILEDARRAASLFEDCLAHAPNNYVGAIALFGRLGLAYDAIFDVTQNIEDIDCAISAKRRAITLQPDQHTQSRCLFGSLAVSLQKHFKAFGKLRIIDEAIGHQEAILRETPDTHSGFRVWKSELARSFLLRPTSSLDDVYTKRLLGMFGHPDILGWKILPSYIDFPVRTKASGNLLAQRDPTTYGRKKAMAYFRMSFLEPYGSPSERLRYAKLWEEQAHSFDIQSSQEGFDEAMGYVQGAIEGRKSISQVQRDLSMVSTVRCRGAAACFQAGDLTKALQTLERNRCLIWRAVLNPASPLVGIKDLDCSLGERILEVSEGLEMAFDGRGGGVANLFEEFKDLGWKALQLPDFEENLYSGLANNFRVPPSGTVVIRTGPHPPATVFLCDGVGNGSQFESLPNKGRVSLER